MPINYDTIPKQAMFIIVAGVGVIYLYSVLMPNGLPSLVPVGSASPRKDNKTGYPESDNVLQYQPAAETNEGQMPVSSQQSNFGK